MYYIKGLVLNDYIIYRLILVLDGVFTGLSNVKYKNILNFSVV
jgi:hypothetical protein